MRKILSFIFILILLVTIAACGGESVKKHNITLNTNGGNDLASIVVEGDQLNYTLPTPEKEGHSFVGWYVDSALTEKWYGAVKEDLTVYAKWIVNSYTLKYVTNSEDVLEEVVYKYGEKLQEQPILYKAGHTFAGWYLDSSFTKEYTLTTMPASDVTLYAKWDISVYEVKFIVDDVTYDTSSVNYNETIAEPIKPSKTGYTFVGWQLDGVDYDFNTPVTSTIDLHAKFAINHYEVYYSIDGIQTKQSYEYKQLITPIDEPTKEGYTFTGWTYYDFETGKEVLFSFVDKTMPAQDLYLKATWVVNTFSIKFHLNGGQGLENLTNIPYGSNDFLPENPLKEGYEFTGWYTDKDLTNKYQESSINSNLELYAGWAAIEYKIHFNANGGNGLMNEQIFLYNERASLIANSFTNEGHTFKGWSTSSDGDVVYLDSAEIYNLTNKSGVQIDLYAVWSINQYAITFDSDGGSEIADITLDYNSNIELPSNPTKIGYTFVGWDINIPTTMPAKDLNVKAVWSINKYTIEFKLVDKTYVEEFTYNSPIVLPFSTDKEGYTFMGWDRQIPTTMPANDLKFVALYIINSYTFTVDYNNGSPQKQYTIMYGGSVNEEANPTLEGFSFEYWALNNEPFDFSSFKMPAHNVTIVAIYKGIYTITFDTDGGTDIAPITSLEGDNISKPSDPLKEGHTFIGWDIEFPQTMPNHNLTISAVWQKNKYTITYLTNGGTDLEPSVLEYGSLLVPPIVEKTGYTFGGWYTDNNFNNQYIFNTVEARDITLHAKWTPNNYTVMFRANGGNGEMSNLLFTYDVSQALTINTFERTGYIFEGWSTSAQGQVIYQDGEVVENLKDGVNDGITLYAVWSPITYQVVFNGNGHTSGTMNKQSFVYDQNSPLSDNLYKKIGHTFIGWSTSVDGDVIYTNAVVVNNLTSTNNDNITLYAIWEINSYTISFVTGNGSVVSSITKDYDAPITKPQNPILTGYSFVGWYSDSEYQNSYSFPETMPAEDVILYAKWEINYYTVTINLSKTNVLSAKTLTLSVPYNMSMSEFLKVNSITLSRVGHSLVINHEGNDYTANFDAHRVIKDVTFDVVYTIKSYTVNFIMDGNIFYSTYLEYGTAISFDDIIKEIRETAKILYNLNEILNNAINGANITTSLTNFHKTYGNVILNIKNNMLVTLYTKLITGKASSSEVETLLRLVMNVYLSYEEAGKTYPMKKDHIFTGWVLGTNTYYLDKVPGDSYDGYAPASTGETSNVVANFVKAAAIEISKANYDEDTRMLTWTDNWNTYVNNYLVKYYGYSSTTKDRFEISFDIANYNVSKQVLYVLGSTTNTSYQFMTNKTFSMPGYYDVLVIANIIVKDEDGHIIANFSTSIGKTIAVTLSPDMENADLTESGEYFYIFSNEKYIYLYTNTSYNFNNFVEAIDPFSSTGENTDLVTVSYEENSKTTLTTLSKTGSFILRSHSSDGSYVDYYASIYPTVTSFSFNDELAGFKFTTANASSSEFLNDSAQDTYKIGNRIEGFTQTDYVNNGVKLDVVVHTNGGLEVNDNQFNDYLNYTFYKNENGSWKQIEGAQLKTFAIYNENSGTWEFNGETGVKYKMVVELGQYYLPQALLDVINPQELIFELNDCINVYSHEKLQSIFANLNYKEGINLHKDIEVYLSDAERYTTQLLNNPAIQLIQTVTYAEHKHMKNKKELDYSAYGRGHIPYGEYWQTKEDILFDGSPLNMVTWELHHLLAKAYQNYKSEILKGNVKEYFDYIATFRTGNVYFRGGIVPADYEENYQIYGNYFEVDGSKLPYMTVNSVANQSNVEGYYIPNCYSSIFGYNISINNTDNTKMATEFEDAYSERYIGNNATLTFNDLIITGNTSVTHQAGDELTNSAIALMNRNSGGYSGITSNYGGNLVVNNTVVRGATLGIAVRYEGKLTMNHTYLLSNWANSLYLHDAGDVVIQNSYIKDSGGAAIYAEDTESNIKNTRVDGVNTQTSHTIKLDINTKIENYISGAEGYFNAYGMTSNVVFLKGQLEPNLNSFGLKSVISVENYLGLKTEMLNFVYMACPAGANLGENIDGTEDCCISLIITDAMGQTIKHNTHTNPPTDNSKKMNLAYLNPGSLNVGYCILSYAIPTKGNSVLGLAVDLK